MSIAYTRYHSEKKLKDRVVLVSRPKRSRVFDARRENDLRLLPSVKVKKQTSAVGFVDEITTKLAFFHVCIFVVFCVPFSPPPPVW